MPAFLTVVTMPLTYSIAYGVIAGICSYIVLYLGNFIVDLVGVALGRNSLHAVLVSARCSWDDCWSAVEPLLDVHPLLLC